MQKQKRKGRWLRRLLRTLIITIGLIIIACLVFDYYYQFRRSDKELNKDIRRRADRCQYTLLYYPWPAIEICCRWS